MSEAGPGLAVVSGTRLTDRIGIGVLTRLIDRDLVDEVLAETGRVEQRSRLLPARVVVYYVLALCLFFGDAYEEVMRLLVAGLLFTRPRARSRRRVSGSGPCHCRCCSSESRSLARSAAPGVPGLVPAS
jgi:hypothetical protein